MNHYAVHLKLTRYCKSSPLQLEKKVQKEETETTAKDVEFIQRQTWKLPHTLKKGFYKEATMTHQSNTENTDKNQRKQAVQTR